MTNKAEIIIKNLYIYLIKKQMSRSWKNKFLPNLHFVLDESFDYAEKIEKLIIKTHENVQNVVIIP